MKKGSLVEGKSVVCVCEGGYSGHAKRCGMNLAQSLEMYLWP